MTAPRLRPVVLAIAVLGARLPVASNADEPPLRTATPQPADPTGQADTASHDAARLAQSLAAWREAKQACGGNYSYVVRFVSGFGFGHATTIVVRKNVVVERTFERFGRPDPGRPPAPPEMVWKETGNQLGSHENDGAAPARTFDELYTLAQQIVETRLGPRDVRSLVVDTRGLLKACFIRDTGIAGDAPQHGVQPLELRLDQAASCRPSAIRRPPASLGVPDFYTKYIDAHGYPIVASVRVNDYALREAAAIVDAMLAERPDIRRAMIESGSRLCIIGWNEFTTDLPEFAALPLPDGFPGLTAKDFWDARARGTGGSETDPYCSCGEENLLGYPGDPYAAECILIHEFAHNIHLRGVVRIDPTFDRRLRQAYDEAMAAGLWKGTYASVNHHEYFAEGVQSWFDDNRPPDHDHNHVNTRAELVDYDPRLAALCREVFGNTEFRYTKPGQRLRDHLVGYDPATGPRFEWPARLQKAREMIREYAVSRRSP